MHLNTELLSCLITIESSQKLSQSYTTRCRVECIAFFGEVWSVGFQKLTLGLSPELNVSCGWWESWPRAILIERKLSFDAYDDETTTGVETEQTELSAIMLCCTPCEILNINRIVLTGVMNDLKYLTAKMTLTYDDWWVVQLLRMLDFVSGSAQDWSKRWG